MPPYLTSELEMVFNDDLLRDHEKRVVAEYRELAERLEKLTSFLTTKTFADLSEVDRYLLLEQRLHMTSYLDVLARRITRF